MIEANKATAFKRGRVLADKPVLTATAIVGTKAVEVKMNSQKGLPGPIFDVEAEQTFTESNLEAELKMICLFVLADYDTAQKAVNAGE